MITTRELKKLDGKIVRTVTTYGEILEGECEYDSEDYLECEFGFDEEGLQIADYIVFKSQIASAEVWDVEADAGSLRAAELKQRMVFSLRRSFSEHLKRWEDNELPDKYDHNAFEYSDQPSPAEFMLALEYQKERGDAFIKLEGRRPLDDPFGLEENAVVTMVLEEMPPVRAERLSADRPASSDDDLQIRKPGYKELQALESKHYGSVYGEDFCRRNIDEQYEYLDFRGAYIGEELVGFYHYFNTGHMTLIDGLLVDQEYRNRGIGTALICDAAELAAGFAEAADGNTSAAAAKAETTGGAPWVLALHADRDDWPRGMYERIGFAAVDTLYEYVCTDISKIKTIAEYRNS